jgi:hypothetical protein
VIAITCGPPLECDRLGLSPYSIAIDVGPVPVETVPPEDTSVSAPVVGSMPYTSMVLLKKFATYAK